MNFNARLVCFALVACATICQGRYSTEEYELPEDIESKDCRNGWIEFGTKCYFFSTTSEAWNIAKDICEGTGGHLVEIDDRNENEFLKETARERDHFYNAYWTGGNDRVRENRWVWENSNTPVIFTDWAHGEPNNIGAQRCVQLWNSRNYQWDNDFCNGRRHYICEIDRY